MKTELSLPVYYRPEEVQSVDVYHVQDSHLADQAKID